MSARRDAAREGAEREGAAREGAAGPPRLTVETMGCRLNAAESEAMRRMAGAAGLEDAVIVNTCAVTAEATRQARQAVRRLRRDNPTARLIVTGCAAQIEPERFAEMAEVDLVLGNAEKMRPDSWRAAAAADFGLAAAEKARVANIFEAAETAPQLIDGFATRARAIVQVQNGCDHRCTFCVIPFGRGRSRSAPAGAVVEQTARLAAAGHAEVVLTGVDLTSWGDDLPGRPRLGGLVGRILRLVPELERLRLSSIDSVEADPALFEALADPRFAPHLHLSLQAGDDLILKRMKRRHLRADAVDFCARARAARPDIALGADLIVGFPTETEEMFAQTLDLVSACGLDYLHVFPFSPRPGTPAARMPQVPSEAVKARAARLRALGADRRAARLRSRVGRVEDVLVEREGRGRLASFEEAAFEGPAPAAVGAIGRARIEGLSEDGRRLRAVAAEDRSAA